LYIFVLKIQVFRYMCPSEIPSGRGMLHTFIERVYCINRAQKATFHDRGMLLKSIIPAKNGERDALQCVPLYQF
jgi:hypothetical protein